MMDDGTVMRGYISKQIKKKNTWGHVTFNVDIKYIINWSKIKTHLSKYLFPLVWTAI